MLGILESGLLQGTHSDVTFSVPGSRKLIRCHKSVLAKASPFLRSLLEDRLEPQEPVHFHLCDISFSEAMAMLNLVYVGRVKLSPGQLENMKSAAKSFLDLSVQVESCPPGTHRENRKRKLHIETTRATPSSSSSVTARRPLLMKSPSSLPPPVLVLMAPPSSQVQGGTQVPSGQSVAQESTVDTAEVEYSNLNSYQKAKLRCADKFKCDQCGKGFPLSCLLQRHKKTHSDIKPHCCHYCDKAFSSKTSLNHHLFMRHLEEKSKKLEEGKRLLERLKDGDGKYTVLDTGGQVIKVLGESRDLLLSDTQREHSSKQVEIIDVQDITQQIAVQMEAGTEDVEQTVGQRDTVIEVVDSRGNVTISHLASPGDRNINCTDTMYYLESDPDTGETWETWEYKS